MSNIIALDVKSRASVIGEIKLINDTYGFDPNDIVVPIRGAGTQMANGAPVSMSGFTARTRKGMEKTSRQVARIEYVVKHSLPAIQAMSALLFLGTVRKRREDVTINEQMVFVASRVHENFVPVASNLVASGFLTKFFYEEDGDVEPVEYWIEENIANIVAQTT